MVNEREPAPLVLVAGAGGAVGRALIDELLRTEPVTGPRRVRALVRREADAALLRTRGIEAEAGDLVAGRGLAGATRGAHTLVYLVRAATRRRDAVSAELRAVQNALLAARAAGVERVIFLGRVGAGESAQASLLVGSWAAELAVRQSRLRSVIVRSPLIVGAGCQPFAAVAAAAGRVPLAPLLLPPDVALEPVALADVVEALRMAIDDAELDGRSFDLCGAERVTGRGLAREWAQARGGRRLLISPAGTHLSVAAALAAPRGLGGWRRHRLLLEPLQERQVCADPSSRFPLPRRPLSCAAAIAALASDAEHA